jgi:hypothetical protein
MRENVSHVSLDRSDRLYTNLEQFLILDARSRSAKARRREAHLPRTHSTHRGLVRGSRRASIESRPGESGSVEVAGRSASSVRVSTKQVWVEELDRLEAREQVLIGLLTRSLVGSEQRQSFVVRRHRRARLTLELLHLLGRKHRK